MFDGRSVPGWRWGGRMFHVKHPVRERSDVSRETSPGRDECPEARLPRGALLDRRPRQELTARHRR
ncbi:hypothetical protein STTU_3468 [Streptomyces sp. Tu6071]|nr:hypothetical protein STTU_3468 [Streptomyces sp. Tu6071]